ncbi:HEPN domain-containing protein [Paenibacillus enshidis]|uniref:HEPN domain-containing protein n=2 Tax=Paenibacillus TaxID=44249 RepID=A0ABV5AZR0_9BACL
MSDKDSWISKAEDDYRAAILLKDSSLWDVSCYHFQQAAEKYLKSILVFRGVQIPRTHDLLRLWSDIVSEETAEDSVRQACENLTFFAVAARYPGYDATKEDAHNCLRDSTLIQSFVLGLLQNSGLGDINSFD